MRPVRPHPSAAAPPSRRAAAPARGRSPALLWGTTLAAAAVLTALAGLRFRTFWRDLPEPRYAAVDSRALQQAFNTSTAGADPVTRDGLVLSFTSERFVDAWRAPEELPGLLADCRARAAGVSTTAFGRAQLAALTLLSCERVGLTPDETWQRIRADIEALPRAHLATHVRAAIDTYARAYEQVGLPRFAALQAATLAVGYAHGPLVQYFTARLPAVAAAREAVGDARGAALCREALLAVLAAVVAEPGPPGLRAQAMSLLEAVLPSDAAPLAERLRGARAAYRAAQAERPMPVALLAVDHQPAAAPDAYRAALRALASAVWLLASVVGAGVVAVGLGAAAVRRDIAPARRAGTLGVGLAAALLVVLPAELWPRLSPADVSAEVRAWTVANAGAARLPLIAAGVATAASGAGALAWSLLGGGGRGAGRAAAVTWLLMAAAAAGGVWRARAAYATYADETWRALQQAQTEFPGGAASGLPAALAAWRPPGGTR